MKKLIGTLSLVMMLGCALALANTDDQQPGTASDVNGSNPTVTNDQTAPDKMENSTTTTTTKTSKSAMNKNCVDDAGKTIQKGQTGYRACIKAHKKDQMGGIASDDTDVNASK